VTRARREQKKAKEITARWKAQKNSPKLSRQDGSLRKKRQASKVERGERKRSKRNKKTRYERPGKEEEAGVVSRKQACSFWKGNGKHEEKKKQALARCVSHPALSSSRFVDEKKKGAEVGIGRRCRKFKRL
jgi:hypothetical protein